APHLNSILVVVSGGAEDIAAVSHAAGLAARADARLTLLSVVEPPRDLARMARAAGVAAETIAADLVQARRAKLGDLVTDAELAQPPALDVRTGKTFIEVIRAVRETGYDLVVKSAEKLSGLQTFIFASTDQHLLRKCPAPVWLRRPDARAQTRTIVAAVDVDTWDAAEPETQNALNRSILHTAAALAALDEAAIEVVHVWDAPGEELVARWTSDTAEPARYRDDLEAECRNALNTLIHDAFVDGSGPTRLTPRLLRGVARDAIPEHARRVGADLLVMGTIARTGVPGLLIGNTAEDVLHRADCSVLTVKPPGYVSPIS
ncbi:MAG: universal stress protein, partial [Maricaulaceae bacterium]